MQDAVTWGIIWAVIYLTIGLAVLRVLAFILYSIGVIGWGLIEHRVRSVGSFVDAAYDSFFRIT